MHYFAFTFDAQTAAGSPSHSWGLGKLSILLPVHPLLVLAIQSDVKFAKIHSHNMEYDKEVLQKNEHFIGSG